jgi:hypothetical protein
MAALRRHRPAHLGAEQSDLLGEDRLRKMVAVALFLNFFANRLKVMPTENVVGARLRSGRFR